MILTVRLCDAVGGLIGEAKIDVTAALAPDPSVHLAQQLCWTGRYSHDQPINPGLSPYVEISDG